MHRCMRTKCTHIMCTLPCGHASRSPGLRWAAAGDVQSCVRSSSQNMKTCKNLRFAPRTPKTPQGLDSPGCLGDFSGLERGLRNMPTDAKKRPEAAYVYFRRRRPSKPSSGALAFAPQRLQCKEQLHPSFDDCTDTPRMLWAWTPASVAGRVADISCNYRMASIRDAFRQNWKRWPRRHLRGKNARASRLEVHKHLSV